MSFTQSLRFKKLEVKAHELVQTYSIALKQEHHEFIDQAWPTSIKRKDSKYLKWKFRSESAEEIENILLAINQKKVVGHLGLIPAQIVIGAKTFAAQWGCNFKVLPGYEGAGYGSLLDIRSLDMKPITLGAAPTKQSEDIKTKLGFKKLEGPRVMVYPIQFLPFIRMKLSSVPLFVLKFISGFFKIIFYSIHVRNYFEDPNSSILSGSHADVIGSVEKFQTSLRSPHVKHDANYIQWRCQAIEGYRSEAQSLRTTNGSFILYYCSSRYCYLHEFYFINDEERKMLLKRLLKISIYRKCIGLYVYSNTTPEEKGFNRFGFLGLRRKINVYAYSREPIDFGTHFYMTTYDSDVNL
jgi:hypothetical protein